MSRRRRSRDLEAFMARRGGRVSHRSAVSGRYVKKSYAKAHPRTTVRETSKKRRGR